MRSPVFAFIERLETCTTTDMTWSAGLAFIAKLGFQHLACCYGSLRAAGPRETPSLNKRPIIRGSFSAKIGNPWSKDELHRHDPLIDRVLASPVPFCWGTEFFDALKLDADVRAFYDLLSGDGARSMFIVPLRCNRKLGVGIAMVGADLPRAVFEAKIAEHGTALTLAAVYTDMRLVELWNDRRNAEHQLATRETECLQYLTTGLKNEQIAGRMGITVHTVQLHLSSAKKKLGASTREQAMAKALMFGIIRA